MTDSPRDIAVHALRDRAGNVSAHLDRLLAAGGLSPQDKGLARELVLGAERRKATLQAVLRAFLTEPGHSLPGPLEAILHVALYQMLFLERVPAFAAVNEAVEQTSRFHHHRKAPLVNGVLRTVGREMGPLQEGKPPFAADVLPVGPGAFRKFTRSVFPDPASYAGGYLAAAMSLPRALCERWIRQTPSKPDSGLGGLMEGAAALALQSNARPPLIFRVNRLKCDIATAAAALAAEGVQTFPHVNGRSLVAAEWVGVRDLKTFRDGLIQPQDPTATAVVTAADPSPGERVLDFCAAPGTKTTQMGEVMDNRGAITAVDVSAERIQLIEDNCRRLGVSIVTTMPADHVGSLEPRSFDLAIVDAPCSNTGVLARRPEARWRFDEKRLNSLAADQRTLVAMASQFVRRGGRLVYSTCSIEPEENGDVARWAAGHALSLALQREELTLPAGAEDARQWRDGGYLAIFKVR